MQIPNAYRNQRVGAEGFRVLALDLDGVCADYTLGLQHYMFKNGYKGALELPKPDKYNLARAKGWPFKSIEEYLQVHRSAVENGLYHDLPIIEGAAAALQELDNHDIHIRVLTHRLFTGGLHQRIVVDTAAWLDNHKIPYMSLCFTGLKDTVDATVYIEDSPVNAEVLVAQGKRVVIYDQLYNRDLNLPRISGWQGSAARILAAFEETSG